MQWFTITEAFRVLLAITCVKSLTITCGFSQYTSAFDFENVQAIDVARHQVLSTE